MSTERPIKLMVGGDGGVGKTTFLYRYCQDKFISDTKLTVGVSFLEKHMEVDGKQYAISLWDLGGQEQFRFILQNYVRGAHGGLLFFALDRYNTFLNLKKWIDLFRGVDPTIPLMLVGARADLEIDSQKIDDSDIQALMDTYQMIGYIRTSSKTGEGIDKPVVMMLKEIESH
ncbi:MAG: Rab family GTPase [Promethearchaeota archaeon]